MPCPVQLHVAISQHHNFSELPYDDVFIDHCLDLQDDTGDEARGELCRNLQNPVDPGALEIFNSIKEAYRSKENLVELTSTSDTYFPVLRGDDDN